MGKLTAAQVRHAKPGRHGDGRGLYLQVIGGSKTWVLRYEHRKRERWMGLGSAEFVSLAQARERAFELRRQLKDQGIDPLERRRAAVVGARLTALKRGTFEEVASQYVEVKSAQWKGDGSRREWLSTLRRYAFSIIGSFSVASIDTALVHRVLDPVWTKKPHVGQRLRERIEAVLEFAKSMGLREGENPARWKGHLANVLPKANRTSRTKHHPALPYAELTAFMAELRALPGVPAGAGVHHSHGGADRRNAVRPLVGGRPASWRLDDPRRAHEGGQGASGATVGSGAGDRRRASARGRV